MKLHTAWLQQYLDKPIPPRELVDAMPRAALEVEAEEPSGDGFQIELKVLPNRPDCLGVIGIAREMAALFDCNVVWPKAEMPTPSGGESVPVQIDEPDLCRRFTAAAFRGVKVGPSPAWLQTVLTQAGLRPINNVVDITNFVMIETGQPSHAFDLAKLAGPQIVVRRIKEGETLDLLVGKPIDATYGQPLCVCDAEKPLALAGIMGGKASGTDADTTDVLLEMAYFDPVHVRKNVKAVRNRQGAGGSDSSYRFERGVDPAGMLDFARRRAYTLILELAGGQLVGPPTDVVAKPTEPKHFSLTPARISRLIGTEVTLQTATGALTKLGYRVSSDATAQAVDPSRASSTPSTGSTARAVAFDVAHSSSRSDRVMPFSVTVPTFRVDVNDPVVLAEDVARMIGYDNIAAELRPARATRGQDCKSGRLRQVLTRALVNAGWYETKNDPLESVTAASRWFGELPGELQLTNPQSAEMAALRRTLLGGLLASTQRNVFRGASAVRLFEIDRTFMDLPGTWTLAGITGGVAGPTAWRGPTTADFYTLKGTIEDAFEAAGIRVTFSPIDPKPGSPMAAGAAIQVDGNRVGWVGELNPKTAKVDRAAFGLYAFEINLALVEPAFEKPVRYTPVSRFPSSVRDLAVVAKTDVPFGEIERVVRASAGAALVKIELVDEFRGSQLPAGHRSLAIRLTFREETRTLTAEEVTSSVDAVVKQLASELSAVLRA